MEGGKDSDNTPGGKHQGQADINGGSRGSACDDDDDGHKRGPSSKIGIDRAPMAAASAFVPVHGLLFLLCDLHMKTPEEILEKVLLTLNAVVRPAE